MSRLLELLGKIGEHGECKKILLSLKERGESDAKLIDLMRSYAQGLITRKLKNSVQLSVDVKAFKDIECSVKVKPVSAYNILVRHCCREGEIRLGLDILERMKESEIELSGATFEPFVKYFAFAYLLPQAESMLAAMKRLHLHGTPSMYEALVRGFARSNNIEKAYNIIEEMHNDGLTLMPSLYNPIIQAYGAKGNLGRAFDVLKEMEISEIKPDSENYAQLLLACASQKNQKLAMELFVKMEQQKVTPSANVISALVTVHTKCGDLEKAMQIVLDKKYSGNIDIKSQSAILWGLAKFNRLKDALRLFDYVREHRQWPLFDSFLCLLEAVGISGDFERLFKLFEDYKQSMKSCSQVLQDERISVVCVIIVVCCIRHKELGRVVDFMQNLQEDGIGDVEILCTKVFLHGTEHIDEEGNVNKLNLEDKLIFIRAMWKKLHLRPSRLAFEALLKSCAKEHDGEKAECIIEMMKYGKLRPNVFTLLIMFQAFVAAKDEAKAEKVLMEIKRTMNDNNLEDEDVNWLLSETLKPYHRTTSASNLKLD
eukprot:c23361_g1_i2 orf=253-1875(+)